MVRILSGLVIASLALTGCQQTKIGSKAPAAPAAQAAPGPGPGIPPGAPPPPPPGNPPPPNYPPPGNPPPPVYPPNNPPPPVYPPGNPPPQPPPQQPPPPVPQPPVTPVTPPQPQPPVTYPPVNPPVNPTNENVPVNPPVNQPPVTPVFQPPSIRNPEVIVPPPPAPGPGPGEQIFQQPPPPPAPIPQPLPPPVRPQPQPVPPPPAPIPRPKPVPQPALKLPEHPPLPVPRPKPTPPPVDPGQPVQVVNGQCGPVDLDAKDKVEEAKLDVLFVVDTSASLRGGHVRGTEGELAQIAAQMGAFVDSFPAKTDIRIGVMLGHGTTQWTGRLFTSGRGDPAVLKVSDFGNDRQRIGRLLKEKMQKVPNESGGAQGEALMYSLYQSVNKAGLRNEIQKDFYRKDAALAVIFVTDEQDVCFNYEGSGYTPVGKVRKNKKGEIISKTDPIEEKFFKNVCQKAGPGRTLLTHNVVYSALKSLKQSEKIILFGIVYTDEKLTPKPGREDENEMGHGIIELVGLQDNPANKLADLNTVQEGPNKFGPELKFFADLAKQELESNGAVSCQPTDMDVKAVNTDTLKAQLLNEKGETIGVFSQDCNNSSCGAGRGGLTIKTRANSRSRGYLSVTLEQKTLNALLNAHKSKNNKVLFTYQSRNDRDVKSGAQVDPKTGKPVGRGR